MNKFKIAGIGDPGADFYTNLNQLLPGGIVLNFVCQIKSLLKEFSEISLIGALGNDHAAQFVRSTLQKNCINDFLETLEGKTPIQEISINKQGEKQFTQYLPGILQNLTLKSSQIEKIKDQDWIHIPIFKQCESLFLNYMNTPKAKNTSIDWLDLADYEKDKEFIKFYCQYATVSFFGLNKSQSALIQYLKSVSIEIPHTTLVITLGDAGVISFTNGHEIIKSAQPVSKVIDTTGAGDAFAAGFVSEFIKNKPIEDSIIAGLTMGAIAVQSLGAIPESMIGILN